MDPFTRLAVALAVLAGVAVIALLMAVAAWRRARARILALEEQIIALDSAKRSQSTRYGQISEQFAPFMQHWPWDPKGFRFIGTPIDGIQFTDEGVILVEIKSSKSRLSTVQRQVRDHVAAGRVGWQEVRIDG